MSQSPQNEWRLNALSCAGNFAQMTGTFRHAALFAQAAKKNSSLITIPMASKLTASPVAILLPDGDSLFAKSDAQVAPLVLPPVVIPKSGELKLKDFKSTSGKRPSPLTLRASESQREIIRRKAREAGVSVGRFILDTVLGAEAKPRPDPAWTQALLATNLELTRQGNNLNQIAKHMNGGKVAPAEAEGLLGAIARSMLMTHKAIRAALTQGRVPEP